MNQILISIFFAGLSGVLLAVVIIQNIQKDEANDHAGLLAQAVAQALKAIKSNYGASGYGVDCIYTEPIQIEYNDQREAIELKGCKLELSDLAHALDEFEDFAEINQKEG